MPEFVHVRTGRRIIVGDGLADRYRNSTRWTEEDQQVVPDGTIAEVLQWVGARRDRRVLALKAELAGKKRKSLIAQLS